MLVILSSRGDKAAVSARINAPPSFFHRRTDKQMRKQRLDVGAEDACKQVTGDFGSEQRVWIRSKRVFQEVIAVLLPRH